MNISHIKTAITTLTLLTLSACAFAWPFEPLPYLWGINLRIEKACITQLHYSWGQMEPFNSGGAIGINACEGELGESHSSRMPVEPLKMSWITSRGIDRREQIDLAQIFKRLDTVVYGGNLKIVINDAQVEVWFAAPDKSKDNGTNFWPKKPFQKIFSSNENGG